MADEAEELEGEESEGGKKKLSGKKLVLFIILPLLLLIGAAAAAYFLLLSGDEPPPAEGEAAAPAPPPIETSTFFDLPDIIVNLNTGSRRAAFLKINVSLELEKRTDIEKIQEVMPRIIDEFQVYLRELRLEDLEGSAGVYRLREELLRRVNVAVRPSRVKDVLFKEMLVQ